MDHFTDTNILVRSVEQQNPESRVARDAIEALRRRGDQIHLVPQNLVEFWVVATRPLAQNGLGMEPKQAMIQLGQLKSFFPVLDETPELFSAWEFLVSRYEVRGKKAHDARIVAAMMVHGVEHILTFDADDFRRYAGIHAIHPRELVR